MSFVSYSLCSLSFLPQTPVPLQCARRCVRGSIPRCETHPYQAEQGAAGVTCQVTASPLLSPHPFVPSAALCPHPRDVSPPALLTARDPLPQLEE